MSENHSPNIFKNLKISLLRIPVYILFSSVLLILYLIEPLWTFRFGHLPSDRIGAYAGRSYILVAMRRKFGQLKRTTEIYVSGLESNASLGQVVARYLSDYVKIYRNILWARIYFLVKPLLERTRFHGYFPSEAYSYDIFNNSDFRFSLNSDEQNRGKDILTQMGIGPNDWFVCFHARDPSYMNMTFNRPSHQHNYRDADISSYLEAMEFITKHGGFAIRVGITDIPLPATENRRIIDYSTNFRSDFGDLILSTQCRFFLGSGAGLIMLPLTFGVQYAAVNMVPLSCPLWTRGAIYAPKLVVEKSTGRLLHYDEVYKRGLFTFYSDSNQRRFFRSDDYSECGVELVANDATDISEICREMYDLTTEGGKMPALTPAQAKFRTYLSDNPEVDLSGPISASFGERWRDLIL